MSSVLLASLASALAPAHVPPSDAWPGWRGPHGSGVGSGAPPVEWSEEKNVRWKTALPGKGISSPIVWGERVFLTSAVPTGKEAVDDGAPGPVGGAPGDSDYEEALPIEEQDFLVLAVDRKSGAIVWQKKVATAMPHETTHPDGSYATPTMVTDGEHVFASFGSYGLFALTLAGELVWQQDLGDMLIQNEFGEGSSPILFGELLLLNWDHEGDSFLVALEKETGKERWRTARAKGTSWTTPVVVKTGDEYEVVVGGMRTVAYDIATGRELWAHGQAGARGGMMSSPAVQDELVLLGGGGRSGEMRALVALPASDAGPDAEPLLWAEKGDTPGIPSPLVFSGMLYVLKGNSGILSVLDVTSGERKYGPERLQGVADVYASPVIAGGHLYVAGRDGSVEVLSLWPKVETRSVNRLEDGFDASPAVAGDELFLRGRASLYCVAAK